MIKLINFFKKHHNFWQYGLALANGIFSLVREKVSNMMPLHQTRAAF
jgi:hypothetical protein